MQSTVVPSLISPEELAALLENPLDLIVLDVSPTSNKSGLQTAHPGLQIPGARKADLKAQFSDPDRPWPNTVPIAAAFSHAAQALGVNHESRVVVYDNLGIYSAPRLWWLFRSMGHQQVSVLDGGLPAWIAAGLPTSPQEENNNYEAGNFEASLDEASVWSRDQVTANLAAPKALVIDARSAGRFAGTAAEPRIGLPSGHIPASCSLPFKSVLQGMKMKSKEELTQLFAELELGDQPLVFSCGSGLTACITLLAADQVLEQPLVIFDGSWTEWAGDQEKVRLVELADKKLLGISRTTTIADPSAAVLWRAFAPRIQEIAGMVTDYRFSLQEYSPAFLMASDPSGIPYTQWAVVEVASFDGQPADLEPLEFPGGLYAIHLHRGLPSAFPATLQRIYGQWLPQSGYQLDDRPHFERLAPDYRPNDPDAVEEVWVPIKK